MEFRHLRYFLALAEELHFGRAAQRLSISQPPLSLNIQQLEASVGAQLFTRNSRGVQLTAAGQAFVPAARALLAQAGAAAREAREVAQGQAGELQIGFAGTLLYCGLPQVLQRFQDSHPRLRLVLRELSSSEQLSELVRDRLDVGFVHTPRVPPGFEQVLVASQTLVACLPQAHPLAGNPLFIRTLAEEMRLFGVHERLKDRLDHYLGSHTLDDLFERVLERVERDCGAKRVRTADASSMPTFCFLPVSAWVRSLMKVSVKPVTEEMPPLSHMAVSKALLIIGMLALKVGPVLVLAAGLGLASGMGAGVSATLSQAVLSEWDTAKE